MCENCQRYADQRDRYMRRMEQAVENEQDARSRLARMLDDIESAEGDREALMGQNAELRARAERAERIILKRWSPRRESNPRPAE